MNIRYWLGRLLVYYLLALLVVRVGFGSFSFYFPRSIFFAEVTSENLLELVNASRQEAALNPLEINPVLNLAAYQKARDMLDKQYFAHHSPDGVDPWHWFGTVGYQYRYAGENLAIHFFDSAEVHQAWMASESHRKNILNPNYQEMGLTVIRGEFEGRSTAIVVQLFGSPYESPVVSVAVREPQLAEPLIEFSPEVAQDGLVLPVEANEISEELVLAPEKEFVFSPSELKLLGASSVATDELREDYWYRFFRFLTRSYEEWAQRLIFYGVILLGLYFLISIIRRPEEETMKACGRTAILALLLLILALISKDLILRIMSYQALVG